MLMKDNTRTQLIDMKRQLTPQNLIEAELKANFTKKKNDVKKFKGRMARLKGMLTQWEPFRQQILKYTAKKEAESKNLPEKIARLRKVLKDECAHPVETLVVTHHFEKQKSENVSALTEYFVECTLCKKKELVNTKKYNYYG